jgi:hypothetical protein
VGARFAATRRKTLTGAPWDFFARLPFAAKTPINSCWIFLDFLGFSRPNRDLSMGYAGSTDQKFFSALLP